MDLPINKPALQYELIREVHRAAKIGTWEVTADDRLLWSDETLDLFGISRTEFSGTMDEFHGLVHPDDAERVKRVDDFADSQKTYFKSEYRVVRPDGGLRHMRQTAIVLRDDEGHPQGFSGVVQDVTDQVETEAQLRQAQKMETIGQLSGGVAHDFNNILAAIMGAAELLQLEKSYDPELVQSIVNSAKRGGELTHRLLAFARKQPLQTTKVDVANLVQGVAPMLDRLIGKDIRLSLEIAPQVWSVETDPAPLEEALLNLSVNARDAITGAGHITISVQNVPDQSEIGDCVEIAVADTGAGMTEAIRLQACDPFFTTKPVGKGSGLGLSMVDGYVRQSGGQLHIRSAPGSGTCIALSMPRAHLDPVEEEPTIAPAHQGNGQSVLVIEDNPELAQLFLRQLEGLNYRATLATDRQSALLEAGRVGGFDIVLSDVLLSGGERGPYVVAELRTLYPRTQPIFMTGFSAESANTGDVPHPDGLVLRKPFRIEDLALVLQQSTKA